MLPPLNPEELERHRRQIGQGVLSVEQQRRLKASTALVTRVGGIGGPAALSLVTAGVGRVIIAHAGELESPDLNRQILGSERGIGFSRAEQFAARLRAMNSTVNVEVIDHEPNDAEADDMAGRSDIILSCAACFEQRLRLNRAAHTAAVPFIDAAQWGITGSLFVSNGRTTPCLACVYPQTPPFETDFPVIGAIAGSMGNLAALEAIKILAGMGRPRWGRMLVIDGLRGETRDLRLAKRHDCPICSAALRAAAGSVCS